MIDARIPVASSRSLLMARIGAKNSRPEIIVRQILHGMGYRFRLHAKEFPGRPDMCDVRRHDCTLAVADLAL
ncbi:hypothetical protein WNZ15_08910 [Roseibium sp. AS2]|uniref:hypothetical protein n=1 Tax=Roseibium sp. AS2 TaxID=3135781 RepID=UPI00317ADC98